MQPNRHYGVLTYYALQHTNVLEGLPVTKLGISVGGGVEGTPGSSINK